MDIGLSASSAITPIRIVVILSLFVIPVIILIFVILAKAGIYSSLILQIILFFEGMTCKRTILIVQSSLVMQTAYIF